MTTVAVRQLVPGQVLAQTIRSGSRILFRSGHTLTQADIQRLKKSGLRSVLISGTTSGSSAGPGPRRGRPGPVITPEAHRDTVDAVKEIYLDYEQANPATLKQLRSLSGNIVDQVLGAEELKLHVDDLREYDEYTYRHSVNVTVISIAMGKVLKFSAQQLRYLATGALVHDIGKMRVPFEVLKKPGPLDAQEKRLMRRHPVYGYEIMTYRMGGSPREWAPIHQHHETMNGLGYPDQKSGDLIHPFARIVAVADSYDALRSDRPYKKGWSAAQVMDFLLSPDMAPRFETRTLEALDQIVVREPVEGQQVQA